MAPSLLHLVVNLEVFTIKTCIVFIYSALTSDSCKCVLLNLLTYLHVSQLVKSTLPNGNQPDRLHHLVNGIDRQTDGRIAASLHFTSLTEGGHNNNWADVMQS